METRTRMFSAVLPIAFERSGLTSHGETDFASVLVAKNAPPGSAQQKGQRHCGDHGPQHKMRNNLPVGLAGWVILVHVPSSGQSGNSTAGAAALYSRVLSPHPTRAKRCKHPCGAAAAPVHGG